MESKEYLEAVATQLVEEIRPATWLKSFTSNPELLGAYTEAAVRRLVARIVFPLHVCTGSVTDVALSVAGEDLPQLDTIVWAPCPVPALFMVGDFGIVPRSSSFGFLEIKRSLYSGVPKILRERTDEAFVRKYVADASSSNLLAALGVVCVKLRSQNLSPIEDLLAARRVVLLFEEESPGEWKARPWDVVRLVNYLTRLRAVSNQVVGTIFLNEELLKDGTA